MQSWPVQDAKARFSELLERCVRDGPQKVTRRGKDAAVVVSATEWERLNRQAPMTIKEWLLAEHPRYDDFEIPERKSFGKLDIPDFT